MERAALAVAPTAQTSVPELAQMPRIAGRRGSAPLMRPERAGAGGSSGAVAKGGALPRGMSAPVVRGDRDRQVTPADQVPASSGDVKVTLVEHRELRDHVERAGGATSTECVTSWAS
jgi:hypothetical protein